MSLSTTLSLVVFMMGVMEASGLWMFTNLLYMLHIGPGQCSGPLQPPHCHSGGGGSGGSSGGDGSSEAFEEESTYEEAVDYADLELSESGGTTLPSASRRLNWLPLLITAVIGIMFVGLYLYKKRVSKFKNRIAR